MVREWFSIDPVGCTLRSSNEGEVGGPTSRALDVEGGCHLQRHSDAQVNRMCRRERGRRVYVRTLGEGQVLPILYRVRGGPFKDRPSFLEASSHSCSGELSRMRVRVAE
ncbi:uncharacterized protein DS421_7g208920 [Arachis hypogaea]|nr:uncharacterized protein DS421_7g208920 [Arachis hypogaea]